MPVASVVSVAADVNGMNHEMDSDPGSAQSVAFVEDAGLTSMPSRSQPSREDSLASMNSEFIETHTALIDASPTQIFREQETQVRGDIGSAGAARPSASASVPTAGLTIDKYQLIRELGRGGMGSVFLARDTRLGRLVAIKFLRVHSPVLAERFVAEARATARCRHENIVVIFDVDEHAGTPYMVLEFLKGQTLRQLLSERRTSGHSDAARDQSQTPLSVERAVELILPVVRALHCAHKIGIVHRDLKPDNVLLTNAGTVKVLDFGLAKLIADHEANASVEPDDEPNNEPDNNAANLASQTDVDADAAESMFITVPGAIMGTLPYMSPEQLLGRPVDHRTDLWAVGIILWEMVTGDHPLSPLSRANISTIGHLHKPMPRMSDQRPSLGKLAAIIDRCLLKDRADRTSSASDLLEQLAPLAPANRQVALDDEASPFAGLAAFQESDSHRFFGRASDIANLVMQLRNQPLVTVTGPSGIGKSSLIRAGVIPALKRSGEGWEAFIVRPGRRPLAALAEFLLQITCNMSSTSSTSSALERDASANGISGDAESASANDHAKSGERRTTMVDLAVEPGNLGTALRKRAERKLRRIVLFVDQFEEIFTLGADAEERAAVLACLEGVADDASSPLRVIISVRADFLERLAEHRQFTNAMTRGLVFLPPIAREGLREVLCTPLENAGYRFESEDTVETILAMLASSQGSLPLLQFTATKLWEERDRERLLLTTASHDALGGISGALASHADAFLAGLSSAERALVRSIFERLVTLERTRAIATIEELREIPGDSGEVERVVQLLASARLVVIQTTGKHGSMVEIVHESLIVGWPTLRHWLDENQDDIEFFDRLRSAAKQWATSGGTDGLLWRGEPAEDAERWWDRARSESRDALGQRERAYLMAVIARHRRSRGRVKRAIVGAFVVLVTVAAVVSYLALRATDEARRADRHAARADEQAALAEREAMRVRVQKTEIEREAVRSRNATRIATARELRAHPTRMLALLRDVEGETPPRGWRPLTREMLQQGVARHVIDHDTRIAKAHWSPDGTRFACASYDNTVHVHPIDRPDEPVRLRGHTSMIYSARFSPDGASIVSASKDGTARVWSLASTRAPTVYRGHDKAVYSARFSPSGDRVISTSRDTTAHIWPIAAQQRERSAAPAGTREPIVLRGHTKGVLDAAFGPDGRRVVTSSVDGTVRLWNANGVGESRILGNHGDWVIAVTFSPDGRTVLSSSLDGVARLWTLDGVLQARFQHNEGVNAAHFSPDGALVVTASNDDSAAVWRIDGSGPLMVLRGHDDDVEEAQFSSDGTRILTASRDRAVRVWNTRQPFIPTTIDGFASDVRWVRFGADSTEIVTGERQSVARVRVSGARPPESVVQRPRDRVLTAHRDGKRLRVATVDAAHRVHVWNPQASSPSSVLQGHEWRVWAADFSVDGTRIVTGSEDKSVRVWNTDGTGVPIVLSGHTSDVFGVAFSPLGDLVASASKDKTVRIWRADGTGTPIVLSEHDSAVYAVAFSPAGDRIASASLDRTARVWNTSSFGRPIVLQGHGDAVKRAAFSPDGTRIATASMDQTVRIWQSDGIGEPVILRGHAGGVHDVAFSPDGMRVATSSIDKTVRIWGELQAIVPSDPRLRSATSYCIPVSETQRLLGANMETAVDGYERCRRRLTSTP